ncbi:putative aldouronate transport system substrate-binding protein [Paenibacillus sp. V4I3]|uniref:extracellular solute-binding protein n=1 Tax=Paenibacillus sp. V4I3 TaxID=3042305 RepID=UPI00278925D2|nr:extracellular solute-binding protein [Paenibacillus sp. V4I3]MDQ0874524.1 putative aldouronate transport system substrate-binding protein [Paenibacillus sp. V4I3]
MKKWLGMTSIVLSMSLIAAGCGGEKSATQTPAGSVKPGETEKPIEITWANNFNAPEVDGNYVQKQIEAKFNVKITNVKMERTSWKDKFNVLLASGQIPDIFPVDANETDMAGWADQGVIASLNQDEIKKSMPNYIKALDSVDSSAWGVGNYKGKNWGIPKVWPAGNEGFIPGYNEAWLKKVGYNEPPKTLAELEDVLTKFVNNDPDGNGKKDTFGLSGRGKLPIQMFTSVFSAYGVSPYQFKLDASGKVVYGGVTEETRSALKLLNKWYKGGLIDPEFITTDNNQLNEKFAAQKIGMVDNMKWGNFYKQSGFITKPGLDKGQQIIAGKPVIGSAGKSYGFSYGALQAPVLLGAQLEKDEKKRTKIMQILDYVATNPEFWLLTVYGQKDVNYDMDGDFVTARTTPEAIAPKAGAGSFYNPLNAVDTSMTKYTTNKELLDLKAKLNVGYEPLKDILGVAILSTKAKYWANLQTLEDAYLIKAVTGEADTDKAFDDFKANWLKSGGQEMTDEVTKVYAERNKK